MKSRRAKIVLSAIAGVVLLGVVWMVWPRAAYPTLSFRLAGYTKTNNTLVATLQVSNSSPAVLGMVNACLVNVTIGGVQTNFNNMWLPPWTKVLWLTPNGSRRIDIAVPLPAATQSWVCHLPVQRPGPRTKFAMLMAKYHMHNRASVWVLFHLPDSLLPGSNISSPNFEVPTNVVSQ